MKYDWPLIGKTFLVGLPLTVVGVFSVIFLGWDEATILLLGIGSLFLVSSVMMAFASLLIARYGSSHLPEDWDQLSFEAKIDFAEKQLVEKHGRVSRMNRWTLQHLRSDM